MKPYVQSLEEIYKDTYPRLKRTTDVFAPCELLCYVSADDLVQNAFLTAAGQNAFFDNHPEIPPFCKLRFILLQIIQKLKIKYRIPEKYGSRTTALGFGGVSGNFPDSSDFWNQFACSLTSPSENAIRLENSQILHSAIEKLSFEDRNIIELVYFECVSSEEGAHIMEMNVKLFYSRHHRALERLKVILDRTIRA